MIEKYNNFNIIFNYLKLLYWIYIKISLKMQLFLKVVNKRNN